MRTAVNGDLTEVWRTRPERDHVRCGEGWLSLPSLVEGCREGGNPVRMNSYGDRLHSSKRIAVLNSEKPH